MEKVMISGVVSPFLISLSFFQGVLLYFLYKSMDEKIWPFISPQTFLPVLSVVLVVPILFILLFQKTNVRKVLIGVIGFSVLVSLIGLYSGFQLVPFNELGTNSGRLFSSYFLMLSVSAFLVCVFLGVWVEDDKIEFSNLSVVSWRFSITLVVAFVFTGIAFGLLALCAAIFDLVGIRFLKMCFLNHGLYCLSFFQRLAFLLDC